MSAIESWTVADEAFVSALSSPWRVQEFLDSIPYSEEPVYRCPLRVVRERKAHCYDGALFAAAALRRQGFEPLLVNQRAVRDDDHVLAVFRVRGRWGAVAKSNFVGLRFREPVYRTLRELTMSYFEAYFNVNREKTLRAYSLPLRLSALDRLGWETSDAAMETIAARLDTIRHVPLIDEGMERALSPVDERSAAAGMLGINEAGLYRPAR